jgi:hypothetical protein
MEKDAEEIANRLKGFETVQEVIVTKAGNAARLVDDHLF